MDTLILSYFSGDTGNREALNLLEALKKTSQEQGNEIQVTTLGESDTGNPTVLMGHISYHGIKEITKLCNFLKKSDEEKNKIVSDNFRDGIIGF